MSKKRKLIIAIIVILILSGISVGIYFVLKENKRIEIVEKLKNTPFMGVKAGIIDSLYQQLSPAELEAYATIHEFQDSLCKKYNFAKKGLMLLSFRELNNVQKELLSIDSSYLEGNKLLMIDLNASLDSTITLVDFLFDWKKSVQFITNTSRQTGVQMFHVGASKELGLDLNNDLLLANFDSLKLNLEKEGLLLSSDFGLLSNELPINFKDNLNDTIAKKDKQFGFTKRELNYSCLEVVGGQIPQKISGNSVRKLLAIEHWIKNHPIEMDTLKLDLNATSTYFQTFLSKRNFSLSKGDHSLIREEKVYAFVNGAEKSEIKEFRKLKKSVSFISRDKLKKFNKPLLIFNKGPLDSALIADINSTKKSIYLGHSNPNIAVPKIVGIDNDVLSNKYALRALAGGGEIFTNTLFNVKTEGVTRQFLTYDNAINVGLNPDTLRQIDYLLRRALSGRAFPGCEVLIAKEGNIVYQKYFGKSEYKASPQIDNNDVYDIASMTKVVATTMVGMKLYEDGHFKLDDPIKNYLPDTIVKYLPYKNHTIANITFRELLIHKSGLPSGGPIINYLDYIKRKKVARFDAYYCDQKDDSAFTVQIADGMYMEKEYQDSMWIKLNSMFLNPAKPYKYSDVNMNLLYRLFKSIIEEKKLVRKNSKDTLFNGFSQYLNENVYNKLEMNNTMYLPRRFKKLDDIVPTEKDNFWRKQLVHGHVHDPSAALLGGVAGNAGIFSNVYDLAILFQMLEQGGKYKGVQIFSPETIQLFVSRQENSHRGLGFNKPSVTGSTFGVCDEASSKTYGHTGFTGTCVWVDPDKDLVYIFLSNRVYPKVNKRIYQYGVRKGIHNIIYKSMLD
jgi:CubicO group peptidase (beta-lactamase class C family)